MKIILAAILLFSPLFAEDMEIDMQGPYYDIPEGYNAIAPCNAEDVLAFFKLLQKRGALIGQKVDIGDIDEKTTKICNLDPFDDYILQESGTLQPRFRLMEITEPAELKLYKGNLHNDGHTCYMLVRNNCGRGRFDFIGDIWKIVDDRIELFDINTYLANSFFPGQDAHRFYGNHAEPFLIEKEGKTYMRWINADFGWKGCGAVGMCTYYWEGDTISYVPSLSFCDDPIKEPCSTCRVYMELFQKLPQDLKHAVPSASFETLKEFSRLQNNTDRAEKYPQIYFSKEGHFALKKEQDNQGWWHPLQLQSDASLKREHYQYFLFRGNFTNDSRDIFILVETHSTPMLHSSHDEVYAWEVSNDKLKRLKLNLPTPWIAHPFITKNKEKHLFHFAKKSNGFHSLTPDFKPYLITCRLKQKN